MQQEGDISSMVAARYSTFDSGFGAKLEEGTATFEDCEEHVNALEAAGTAPKAASGKQELYDMVLNRYV